MRNVFVEFYRCRRFIKENKTILNSIKYFLDNGIYECNISGNIIYNIESYNKALNIVIFNNDLSLFTKFFVKYFARKKLFINEYGNKYFDGNMVIISSSRTVYKIFSKSKKEIMSIILDRKRYKKEIFYREVFNKFFDVPKIILKEEKERKYYVIIEEKIVQRDFEFSKYIFFLFDMYCVYLQNTKKYINKNSMKNSIFLKKFNLSVSEKVENIPNVVTHGDFWTGNIIFDGEKFYLIDFEFVKKRSFFYDFFSLIVLEYFINDNHVYLNDYFNGEYDDVLKKLFNSVNLLYDEEQKKEYLIVFFSEIYAERWIEVKSYNINKKIMKLVNQYMK